jgi:hypothetical protein
LALSYFCCIATLGSDSADRLSATVFWGGDGRRVFQATSGDPKNA